MISEQHAVVTASVDGLTGSGPDEPTGRREAPPDDRLRDIRDFHGSSKPHIPLR
jgi:hypothetical protein